LQMLLLSRPIAMPGCGRESWCVLAVVHGRDSLAWCLCCCWLVS
jgi:hypothetical protein